MMNGLEPLFYNGTGRRKGIPKGVDETHLCMYVLASLAILVLGSTLGYQG